MGFIILKMLFASAVVMTVTPSILAPSVLVPKIPFAKPFELTAICSCPALVEFTLNATR